MISVGDGFMTHSVSVIDHVNEPFIIMSQNPNSAFSIQCIKLLIVAQS